MVGLNAGVYVKLHARTTSERMSIKMYEHVRATCQNNFHSIYLYKLVCIHIKNVTYNYVRTHVRYYARTNVNRHDRNARVNARSVRTRCQDGCQNISQLAHLTKTFVLDVLTVVLQWFHPFFMVQLVQHYNSAQFFLVGTCANTILSMRLHPCAYSRWARVS